MMNELAVAGLKDSQGLIARLKLAQAIAGGLFALFLMFHLVNFYLAPFGLDVFNDFQRLIRPIYQFPPIELMVVLGPLVVHTVSGLWLLWLRPKRARLSWHAYAGFFLLLVIVGHVVAVRGPSFWYGVFPEFEGLSFSLWYFPVYFYPYYFLLALAGFYHMAIGINRIGGRFSLPVPRRTSKVIIALAVGWTLISLLALGGHLFSVPNPSDSDFARLGEKLFDLDVSQPWL